MTSWLRILLGIPLMLAILGGAGGMAYGQNGRAVILVDLGVSQYKQTAGAVKRRVQGEVKVVDIRKGGDPVMTVRSLNPKVVIAVGTNALQMAAQRIKDVPVIYCTVLYPERTTQLPKNISGVPMEIPVASQLRYFKMVAPKIQRLGVIYTPSGSGFLVDEAMGAAKKVGLRIVPKAVKSRKDVGSALETMLGSVDAIWLVPDNAILNKDIFRFLLSESMGAGKPLFGFLEGFTQAGALASVSPNYEEIGRIAASMANEVLRTGRTPSKRYGRGALSINLKTASRLGIRVSASAKKAAARVFD